MGSYPPTTGALLQSAPPATIGQAAAQQQSAAQQQTTSQQVLPPPTYKERSARYEVHTTQRVLSQRRADELLEDLKQEWPQPGNVRLDRFWDRKNRDIFHGDKPNRYLIAKPGPNTKMWTFYKTMRIDVPTNTKAIAFGSDNLTGVKQQVFKPGNSAPRANPSSMIVLPDFNFDRVINAASKALSDFAKPDFGCLLTAENWQTHPLVQAYEAFMDKVIAAHDPSPSADAFRKTKADVLLTLSNDVISSQDQCGLYAKPPCREGLVRPTTAQQRQTFKDGGYVETPPGSACWKAPVACPEGTVRAQRPQVQQMLQGLGYVERPAGSKCYGKPQVQCPPGAQLAENEIVAQTLRASGYEESSPGSGCFLKPTVTRQCNTLWHIFPNRERVCIPQNRFDPQCLDKGGRYEARINTRTGKIRTDTIACMIPNVQRREIGTPNSPERAAWYEDIKSRAVYPSSRSKRIVC